MDCDDEVMHRAGMEERKWGGFVGETMIVLPTEDLAGFIEHPMIKRLYLTDIGFFPGAARHFVERKDGREEYILIYCLEGKGFVQVEECGYELYENEAFCIPKRKCHSYYADRESPWSIFWVHFKGTDTVFFPLSEGNVTRFETSFTGNKMQFLFGLIFRVLEGNYTLENFIYISQVLSLILSEIFLYRKSSIIASDRHVTDIIKFMYSHMAERFSLEQLSDEFGLSKSYINAVFIKFTKHSPIDFFILLKIRKACRQLKESEKLVSEIAFGLGYKDQFYFSKLFKKVVGISPSDYRNSDYYYLK